MFIMDFLVNSYEELLLGFIEILKFLFHDKQVFDITTLQIFNPQELDYLLCGRRELWKVI